MCINKYDNNSVIQPIDPYAIYIYMYERERFSNRICMIYYGELTYAIMETEKFHSLPLAS